MNSFLAIIVNFKYHTSRKVSVFMQLLPGDGNCIFYDPIVKE